MGVSVEAKGGWRINAFLFLLTGSQAVLLPWFPVILKATGMSAAGVGVVMGVITLAGSLGVCGNLIGMRRTHSGAARRLMLLLLTISAAVLYMSAVMLLPSSAGGNTCLASSFVSSETSNLDVPLSHNDSEQSITVTKSANGLDLSTSAPQQDKKTTPRIIHQLSTTEKSVQNEQIVVSSKASNADTLVPETTKRAITQPEMITENSLEVSVGTREEDSSQSIEANAATTDAGKGETENSTQNKPEKPLSLSTIGHNRTNSVTDNQLPSSIHPVKSNATSVNSFKPSTTPFIKDTTQVKANNGSNKPIDNFREHENIPSKGNNAKKSQQSFSGSNSSQGNRSFGQTNSVEDDLMVTSTKSKEPPIVSINMEKETLASPGEQSVSEGIATEKISNSNPPYDDYYDYYDYSDSPFSYDYPNPADTSSVRKSPEMYRNTGKSPLIQPAPPPPPLLSPLPVNTNNLLRARSNNPAQWFKIPKAWQSSFQKLNENRDEIHSLNPKDYEVNAEKFPKREEQLGSRVSVANLRNQGHNEHDSARNEFQAHRPHSARTYEKSGRYHDHYNGRGKRSIKLKDQSLHQQGIKANKGNGIEISQSTNGADAAGLENAASHHNDVNTRGLMENINSPVGIQTGVSLLLVLGSLVGAGIEVGVAQLWHCYAHGYDEGSINQDILQRTITHTFHISVYAAHKTWAGFTSGVWVVGGGFITSLICMAGVDIGVYGMLGSMQLALGVLAVLMLLVIPVPYGSVDPPKTRRPLSLYLDDEVLREGVRRLAFHIWILVNGFLTALPLTFQMWVILEMTESQGSAVAVQTGAVAVMLASESLSLQGQRWLMARLGLQGTMGVGGLALMLYLATMWASQSIGLIIVSHAGLGCSIALLWVSVRHNAILLATINDQEQEAWASWWCWRVGVGVGAVVWGVCVHVGAPVAYLFKPAAFVAASVALAVASAAALTIRRQGRTRRRVYHTLDLDMAGEDDEDDDEENANEDDWLVKRAKKEGITL